MTFLTPTYGFGTVLGSVLMGMFASYVALDLSRRVHLADRALALVWLGGGSLVMGTGIWSMHFLGMLALKLRLIIGFEPALTALSWAAAVLASGIALGLTCGDHLTPRRWLTGSLLMAAAICAMHYVGMASMQMTPAIVWDLPWLAASVAVALAASAAALQLFFRLRQAPADRVPRLQLGAAVAMGLAISGMHYAGMAAARFPASSYCGAWDRLSGSDLALMVAGATTTLLAISQFSALLDARLQNRASRLSASLAAATEELQRATGTDPLTALPNRLALEDRLDGAVTRNQDGQPSAGVLFVDLDGFKPINASYGHAVGDAVLRETAQRLQHLARKTDLVARVGADEFLMLLDGQPDRANAALVAQRIRDAIREPFLIQGHEIVLSCSVGIALYPEHGPRGKLIANADAAMNAAKRAGGGVHCFYEPYMDAGSPEQIDLQRDLRVAIARSQLELHYQPKVHTQTGQITGVEALLRWHHPTRGMVSPGVFIPLAERFGIIGALGNWVIEEACRQVRVWLDGGLRLRVAMNLSVHQLRQTDLDKRVKDALSRHRVDLTLPPKNVVLG